MKAVITFLKSIAVAFSMYSRIPMPSFKWNTDDMKYQLIFFPWIGAIIGGAIYLWNYICGYYWIDTLPEILFIVAIPILITGGLHVDGFMDTCDALHSYQERERKLEILKDPHIGAFSVICLVTYMLILLSGLSLVVAAEHIEVLCFVPFIVRAFSGIAIQSFKPAKDDGMLKVAADNGNSKVVKPVLIIELVIAVIAMCLVNPVYGIIVILIQIAVFIYYRFMSYRQFGGVTGDLAGYYVTIAELAAVITIAICSQIVFF